MVGGMVTAPLLSLLVVPAAWYLMRRRTDPGGQRPVAGRTGSALSGMRR